MHYLLCLVYLPTQHQLIRLLPSQKLIPYLLMVQLQLVLYQTLHPTHVCIKLVQTLYVSLLGC